MINAPKPSRINVVMIKNHHFIKPDFASMTIVLILRMAHRMIYAPNSIGIISITFDFIKKIKIPANIKIMPIIKDNWLAIVFCVVF